MTIRIENTLVSIDRAVMDIYPYARKLTEKKATEAGLQMAGAFTAPNVHTDAAIRARIQEHLGDKVDPTILTLIELIKNPYLDNTLKAEILKLYTDGNKEEMGNIQVSLEVAKEKLDQYLGGGRQLVEVLSRPEPRKFKSIPDAINQAVLDLWSIALEIATPKVQELPIAKAKAQTELNVKTDCAIRALLLHYYEPDHPEKQVDREGKLLKGMHLELMRHPFWDKMDNIQSAVDIEQLSESRYKEEVLTRKILLEAAEEALGKVYLATGLGLPKVEPAEAPQTKVIEADVPTVVVPEEEKNKWD
ncbi:MAG: hypothetical protein HYY52_01420 [Candidatus Melainabacteria bacterium]|nr:hypothetical protein [Candidatus Melainabacteria bacterium]